MATAMVATLPAAIHLLRRHRSRRDAVTATTADRARSADGGCADPGVRADPGGCADPGVRADPGGCVDPGVRAVGLSRFELARLAAHVARRAEQVTLRCWHARRMQRTPPGNQDCWTLRNTECTMFREMKTWKHATTRWAVEHTMFYVACLRCRRGSTTRGTPFPVAYEFGMYDVVRLLDPAGNYVSPWEVHPGTDRYTWSVGDLVRKPSLRLPPPPGVAGALIDRLVWGDAACNDAARRARDGPLCTTGARPRRRSETRVVPCSPTTGAGTTRRLRVTTLWEVGGGGAPDDSGGGERVVHRASSTIETGGTTGGDTVMRVTALTLGPGGETEVCATTDRDHRLTVDLLRPYPDGRVYGYKAARTAAGEECLVKLLIPDEARVAFSDDDPKCRADVAVVARIVLYAYVDETTSNNNNNNNETTTTTATTIQRDAPDRERDAPDGVAGGVHVFEGRTLVDADADRCGARGHVRYLERAATEALSAVHREPFRYAVGETVRATDYDPDLARTCVPGIHFCWTQEEALRWNAVFATRDDLDGFEDLRAHNDALFDRLHGVTSTEVRGDASHLSAQ